MGRCEEGLSAVAPSDGLRSSMGTAETSVRSHDAVRKAQPQEPSTGPSTGPHTVSETGPCFLGRRGFCSNCGLSPPLVFLGRGGPRGAHGGSWHQQSYVVCRGRAQLARQQGPRQGRPEGLRRTGRGPWENRLAPGQQVCSVPGRWGQSPPGRVGNRRVCGDLEHRGSPRPVRTAGEV